MFVYYCLIALSGIYSSAALINKADIIPCSLPSQFQISCNGKNITNDVLKRVGPKMVSDTPIDIFSISETLVTEIAADTFPGADFKNINIENNANLVKIDAKAFRSPKSMISSVQINSNPKLIDENVFALIRNLKVDDAIHINGNGYTELPSFAFAANASKRALEYITLYDNKIKRIHANAFNGVASLKRIALYGNQIEQIDENGLAFDQLDTNKIQINIAFNALSEKGLVKNSIKLPSNTALSMIAEENKFTVLEEEVWKPVFSNGLASEIFFAGNPFKCDCKMKWIIDIFGTNASRRLGDIRCANAADAKIYDLKVEELKC